jgi:ketosteroid isomerase-like protein
MKESPMTTSPGKTGLGIWLALMLLLPGAQTAFGAVNTQTDGLDAFWAEIARTVTEGDFAAYSASYHDDAVLVSGSARTSQPVSQALAGWEQGFTDTRDGKKVVSLEFRFTQRFSDATTAHETGIFHYSATGEGGEREDTFVHFEALLVRQGAWKTLMEYQKSSATQEEWDAAMQK